MTKIDDTFSSNPKPLPKERAFGKRILGLAALSAADIAVPDQKERMNIADYVGAVLFELAPQLYQALADKIAEAATTDPDYPS